MTAAAGPPLLIRHTAVYPLSSQLASISGCRSLIRRLEAVSSRQLGSSVFNLLTYIEIRKILWKKIRMVISFRGTLSEESSMAMAKTALCVAKF